MIADFATAWTPPVAGSGRKEALQCFENGRKEAPQNLKNGRKPFGKMTENGRSAPFI